MTAFSYPEQKKGGSNKTEFLTDQLYGATMHRYDAKTTITKNTNQLTLDPATGRVKYREIEDLDGYVVTGDVPTTYTPVNWGQRYVEPDDPFFLAIKFRYQERHRYEGNPPREAIGRMANALAYHTERCVSATHLKAAEATSADFPDATDALQVGKKITMTGVTAIKSATDSNVLDAIDEITEHLANNEVDGPRNFYVLPEFISRLRRIDSLNSRDYDGNMPAKSGNFTMVNGLNVVQITKTATCLGSKIAKVTNAGLRIGTADTLTANNSKLLFKEGASVKGDYEGDYRKCIGFTATAGAIQIVKVGEMELRSSDNSYWVDNEAAKGYGMVKEIGMRYVNPVSVVAVYLA